MATYRNPLGSPNPFFTRQPIVLVVRHVRTVAATGEVVAEDPNQMPRYIRRLETFRTYPQRVAPRTVARNIPANDTKKVPW